MGAIAVIVSLLYVGSEIKRNTAAVRQSNHQAALDMGHEWDAWLKDDGFAETYVLANEDDTQLTPAQLVQLNVWIGQGMNIWEFVLASTEEGLLEEHSFAAWDRFFTGEIRDKVVWRRAWHEKREAYYDRFQLHVDSILAKD